MLAGPAPGDDSELPPYTRRHNTYPMCHPGSADHVFTLSNSKGKPWAMLRLISSATSSGRMPTYYQGDRIIGSFSLNLEKQEAISSITATVSNHVISCTRLVLIRPLQVTGRIVTGAGSEDVFKFFDHTSVIWNKLMGDPRSTEQGDYKGKLKGNYVWPVSVEIPTTNVCPGSRPTNEVYDLPQTFLEPNIRASVEYTLSIRISRSMLRADSM
jgi:hypothetical protein